MVKKKTEVKSTWRYRLFVTQLICVLMSSLLISAKLIWSNISWKLALSPMLISIGLPLLLLVSGFLIFILIFGIIYLFKDKESRVKMVKGVKNIKWKRVK